MVIYGPLSLLVNSGSKFLGFVGCMSKVLKIGLKCLKQSCKLRHTSTFEGRGPGGRDRVSMSQLRTRTGKIDGLWNLRLPLELQVAMKLKWFQHPACQAARPDKQTNWVLDVLKFGYARFLSLCFLCRTPIHHVRESRTWRTCCTDTPQHFTGQSLNSLQHQWKYSHRMSTNACSQFVSWHLGSGRPRVYRFDSPPSLVGRWTFLQTKWIVCIVYRSGLLQWSSWLPVDR